MDEKLLGVAGAPARTVAVVSNLRLLGETVAAALSGHGLGVVRVDWPGTRSRAARGHVPPGAPPEEGGAEAGALARAAPDLALLVCEPESVQLSQLTELLNGYDGPTLVMMGTHPTPLWGALLLVGADDVIASTTTLERLVEALFGLVQGERVTGVAERRALVRSWLTDRADDRAVRVRVERLTPRELQVLELLHEGASATAIAERFEVSPATVRSQIRAVLGKLEVHSQLAAVAVYESVVGR